MDKDIIDETSDTITDELSESSPDTKKGRNYSALAFTMIVLVYSSLFLGGGEFFALFVFTLGIAAALLSVKTLRHSSRGKVLSVIVIILEALPVLAVLAIIVMTIGWFIMHPDYEP